MRSVANLMDLAGRVAAITGGAGHIGRRAALGLAELGATVVLLDLPRAKPAEVAASLIIPGGRGRIVSYDLDLADEAAVRATPAALAQSHGRLDILVHCAALVGTTPLKGWAVPFAEQSADTWRLCQEINLTAPFVLTQAAAPFMRQHRCGSVIFISSVYGVSGPDMRIYGDSGLGNPAAYAASKGGLISFMRWLSTTLAPDVRSNAIVAGGVERGQAQTFQAAYCSRTPMGRMATEEDFVGAISFLASDLSAYVTGVDLAVDGGWTAW